MKRLGTNGRLNAYRSYHYWQETLSLLARIALTIAIEMIVALLFGFREKEAIADSDNCQPRYANCLECAAQYYQLQFRAVGLHSVLCAFEIIVFAMEAVLYCKILKKASEQQKEELVLCSLFICCQFGVVRIRFFPGKSTAGHILSICAYSACEIEK